MAVTVTSLMESGETTIMGQPSLYCGGGTLYSIGTITISMKRAGETINREVIGSNKGATAVRTGGVGLPNAAPPGYPYEKDIVFYCIAEYGGQRARGKLRTGIPVDTWPHS